MVKTNPGLNMLFYQRNDENQTRVSSLSTCVSSKFKTINNKARDVIQSFSVNDMLSYGESSLQFKARLSLMIMWLQCSDVLVYVN